MDEKATYPYAVYREDLLSRLRRCEGQIRGIQHMIEEDRYCVDILNQTAAVRAALRKVELSLLESHTLGCVSSAMRSDNGDKAVTELMDVLRKII